MHTPGSIAVGLAMLCAPYLATTTAHADEAIAKLSMAMGVVTQGERKLKEGDTLAFESLVLTNASSLASVRVEWVKSESRCFAEYLFGFGVNFRVPRPAENANCDTGTDAHVDSRIISKFGFVMGKGDQPSQGEEGATEFDNRQSTLSRALSVGMIVHYEENRRAYDYNQPGNQVKSALECANLCANAQRCNAFTYISDQNICWLKEQVGTPVRNIGMVSGVKKQHADPRVLVVP
jgi:hypothetical protein